jgi:RNA polymerase primary sigma factor
VAVTRAPKKGGKAGKNKSKPAAKKSSAKKVVVKKVKAAKKPIKIPAKGCFRC